MITPPSTFPHHHDWYFSNLSRLLLSFGVPKIKHLVIGISLHRSGPCHPWISISFITPRDAHSYKSRSKNPLPRLYSWKPIGHHEKLSESMRNIMATCCVWSTQDNTKCMLYYPFLYITQQIATKTQLLHFMLDFKIICHFYSFNFNLNYVHQLAYNYYRMAEQMYVHCQLQVVKQQHGYRCILY